MSNIVRTLEVKIPGVTAGMICVEVGKGQWCFTTPGQAWKYDERVDPPHNNFALYCGGAYQYQMRVDSIRAAVCYAVGFSYGYTNGYRHGQDDVAGATAMVEQARKLGEQASAGGAPVRREKA